MRLADLVVSPRLPRRTVRLRLTLLYGVLFLLSGAALLTITYFLVHHATSGVLFVNRSAETQPSINGHFPPAPQQLQDLAAQGRQLRDNAVHQHNAELHQLLVQSGIALGLMSVVSIALGWLVAGRVLAPLRTMTATTRRISEANLHERLALSGPRDELKELGDTIDGLLARLEAAFDAQRRFVANASHELRTPLAMMRTSVDVATGKPGPVPAQVTALGDKVREGLDQAERLLESFLTLARAQQEVVGEQTTVELPAVVSAALAARADAIDEKGITLERALGDAGVAGSETLLTRLVENVLDNAVVHNEPGGWIRVATGVRGETAQLEVQSSGALLEDERVRELAQPFRRLGSERTGSQDGVGLGLSIVSAIADAHGGSLELAARPEGGLRVLIELPRAGRGARVAPEASPAREVARSAAPA